MTASGDRPISSLLREYLGTLISVFRWRLVVSLARAPGMRAVWEGASPSANLMEVKAREAQGRHREVGSEGSVEQTYEPTNGNWISRRQGRTSQRVVTKSISIKDRKRKSSGCVRKGREVRGGPQTEQLGCGPREAGRRPIHP